MKKALAIVLAVLMVLSLITTCLLSSTFAKYVTSGSGTASARVAKWGVTVQTDISGLFLDRYNVNDRNEVISFNGDDIVAPGTSNSFYMNTSVSGVPEVAVEVLTTAKITISNWEVNGDYYCPLTFTINGATKNGNEFKSAEEFEAWIEKRIAKSSAKYPPLTDLSTAEEINLAIYWEWPFEVDDDNDSKNGIANDILDTALGNKAADNDTSNDPKIEFSITQTVSQIDSYESIIERDDDKIKFGSYPQTDVTDTAVASTLSAKAGIPSTNSSAWTSYGYYINGQQSDYMWYTDVEEGGEKYRGVYFSKYRPYVFPLESSMEYSTQDDNNYRTGKVYWFKYEPISWSIISENADEGTALILSDMILNSNEYDYGHAAYSKSYLKTWLNESFYSTAFNDSQKELVLITDVVNDASSTGYDENAYAGEITQDKIFLLSYAEVTNPEYKFTTDTLAKAPTDYAKAQGIGVGLNAGAMGSGGWWLRSPSNVSSLVRVIEANGTISNQPRFVDNTSTGVVPALRIQLPEEPHACHDTDKNHYCDECDAELSSHNYEEGECTICSHQVYILNPEKNKIKFGSYPQTDVTDTVVASTLSARVGNPATNPSEWTSYGYYANGEQSDYMWYTDVEEGGEKYRGVYFTEYRPFHTTIASSAENSYQDDNGYTVNNVYWFKYEPLSWTILNENSADGTALILCDMIIDSQEYYTYDSLVRTIDGKTVHANNYAYSSVRTWLNEVFYETTFNELQQKMIVTTTVDNSVESTGYNTNIYACEDTQDNIFLMSVQELLNGSYGFSDSASIYDSMRQKENTDYAKIQGIVTCFEGEYSGNGCWMTRSPYNGHPAGTVCICYSGDAQDHFNVHDAFSGIVPALRIKL